jgi:hypothetical protein
MPRSFFRVSTLLIGIIAVAGAIPLACGGEDSSNSGGNSGNGGNGGNGGNTTGGDSLSIGAGMTAAITVQPATATIEVVNGVSTPIDFNAFQNGQELNSNVAWSVNFTSVASIDGLGVASASNTKGGQVVVTASTASASGTAILNVKLRKDANPAGVDPGSIGILEAAVDPDPATQWLYPYDKTVFPRGLAAPELMWNGGGPSDLYMIHYKTDYVDYKVFTTAAPPSRFALDLATWKEISESGAGGPLNLRVTKLVPGAPTATVVVNQTWTMSRANLAGTVYYWSNNKGRILRIQPGAAAPDDFLLAAGISDNCSTCHTVSANGSTLVMGGDVSTSTFDLITSTGVFSLSSVGKPVRNWAMPAVSPNGKFVVENNAPLPGPPGGSDGMWDAVTGQKLAGTGLDGVFLDMPAFGPSGKHLAYVDHNSKDLAVYTYDSLNNVVSNPVTLVPAGGDPNLNCIAFPSVSPTVTTGEFGEKTWIVYHRGAYPNSLDTRFGFGDLYLASADQPGIEIPLDQLNGIAYPFAAGDRDRHFNYEPTFMPVNSGGYSWVVFTSRRTYGNRLTADKNSTKQLWVAAVDQLPEPGKDPSYPAFWVPGQDEADLNMRAFWALKPCAKSKDGCATDDDCCDGNHCNKATGLCGGEEVCIPDGGPCKADGDCCGANCDEGSGFCGTVPN